MRKANPSAAIRGNAGKELKNERWKELLSKYNFRTNKNNSFVNYFVTNNKLIAFEFKANKTAQIEF